MRHSAFLSERDRNTQKRGSYRLPEEDIQITSDSDNVCLRLCFPILFSPPLPVSYSSFFSTLQRLATIKLKKETRQHAEVPRSAGIINKSAEEEVNCCNQLIQPTAADGERF